MGLVRVRTLLTEDEAAEFLNVPTTTLQGWRFRKAGPTYFKHRRQIRYPLGYLKAFIRASAVRNECVAA